MLTTGPSSRRSTPKEHTSWLSSSRRERAMGLPRLSIRERRRRTFQTRGSRRTPCRNWPSTCSWTSYMLVSWWDRHWPFAQGPDLDLDRISSPEGFQRPSRHGEEQRPPTGAGDLCQGHTYVQFLPRLRPSC